MKFKFIKENNKWYIYIPEYKGDKDDLKMVCNADKLLEYLSNGNQFIELNFNDKIIPNYDILLTKSENSGGGAWYNISHNLKLDISELWLCEVTAYIFNYIPDKIYIKL